MERIQERLEQAMMQRFHGNQTCAVNVADIEYLLAENKRLNDVLKKINHRATSYSNHEVPTIVLNEIREMAGYATNQFIDHQTLRDDEA